MVTYHGNVSSTDVTWLHKTADVCVKCSVTFAILGNLCFVRDTMKEIRSAMGMLSVLFTTLFFPDFLLVGCDTNSHL